SEAELLLSGEESSAVETVGRALGLVNEATKCDASLAPVAQALGVALAELEEAQRRLNRYVEGLESDPARLGEVEDRLDALKRLCRKHATTLEGVLQKRDALEAELSTLDNRQEVLEQLARERKAAEERARRSGEALSRARAACAVTFGA